MSHRFTISRGSGRRMREFCENAEALGMTEHHMADSGRLSQESTESNKTAEYHPVSLAEEVGQAPLETHGSEMPEGLRAVSRTHVGLVRPTNQDAVLLEGRVAGVADGMGGHQGGEIASAGARDGLLRLLRNREPDEAALAEAVREVNLSLYHRSRMDEALRGMGTTLTVLWAGDENMLIAHVGDSRCYLLRDGELRQVTDDHSMVMEMVRAGALTAEEAARHPMRNVITRAVATEPGVEVDTLTFERKAGDLWLICSDGLHGMVPEPALLSAMREADSLDAAADSMIAMALDAGGRDNVSLVLLKDLEGAQ